jgi:hypothetical protein
MAEPLQDQYDLVDILDHTWWAPLHLPRRTSLAVLPGVQRFKKVGAVFPHSPPAS